jgi:hypothetical protein
VGGQGLVEEFFLQSFIKNLMTMARTIFPAVFYFKFSFDGTPQDAVWVASGL